jgi:hypothetical protein
MGYAFTVKLAIDLKDKEIVHTHIYNISGKKIKSLISKKTKPKQNNQNRQRLPMVEEFANELMSRNVIFGEIGIYTAYLHHKHDLSSSLTY